MTSYFILKYKRILLLLLLSQCPKCIIQCSNIISNTALSFTGRSLIGKVVRHSGACAAADQIRSPTLIGWSAGLRGSAGLDRQMLENADSKGHGLAENAHVLLVTKCRRHVDKRQVDNKSTSRLFYDPINGE